MILSVPSLLLAGKQAQAAMATAQPFSTLGVEEAATLEAIASRIIPSDETPGAAEAGVIYFMDNILGGSRAEVLPEVRKGLAELYSASLGRFGTGTFYILSPEQQDSLLRDIERTPFFNTLRYLTIAGMFTMPSYGGNKNRIGWQLIGFEDRHVWQPPYGYYDADYMEKGA
ncbi:MAG: gluconate 2-dehydrogenase subunit 3 family protein [Pseudomonadales bacterium]|nr:gluconate 2-dehydrogenase subunit 3 family protein [Pseudomonadales bacterium]